MVQDVDDHLNSLKLKELKIQEHKLEEMKNKNYWVLVLIGWLSKVEKN